MMKSELFCMPPVVLQHCEFLQAGKNPTACNCVFPFGSILQSDYDCEKNTQSPKLEIRVEKRSCIFMQELNRLMWNYENPTCRYFCMND